MTDNSAFGKLQRQIAAKAAAERAAEKKRIADEEREKKRREKAASADAKEQARERRRTERVAAEHRGWIKQQRNRIRFALTNSAERIAILAGGEVPKKWVDNCEITNGNSIVMHCVIPHCAAYLQWEIDSDELHSGAKFYRAWENAGWVFCAAKNGGNLICAKCSQIAGANPIAKRLVFNAAEIVGAAKADIVKNVQARIDYIERAEIPEEWARKSRRRQSGE